MIFILVMFMSSSESNSQGNDPANDLEVISNRVWEDAKALLSEGDAGRVSDVAVARIMTAAIKLYAAKADGEMRSPKAVLGQGDVIVTPTEALTTVTEILRALRLGPMEFGLWSRRRPEDYHDIPPEPLKD
ncbi:MAG: hypothetical protein VW462_08405 [Rhodospirillales bacterium]